GITLCEPADVSIKELIKRLEEVHAIESINSTYKVNKLQGPIVVSFRNLSLLESLKLKGNNLTGFVPRSPRKRTTAGGLALKVWMDITFVTQMFMPGWEQNHRANICSHISDRSHCALVVICIMRKWHLAGTFNCQSRTGGPLGTMRFDAEQAHGANSLTGGPKIPFHPVREDKPQPPPEGRLPDATKGFDHLRDVYAKQMGFSDKDIVALSGAHTLFLHFRANNTCEKGSYL
ncbi:unnamed protein product, partial [Arabidopsis halleri]